MLFFYVWRSLLSRVRANAITMLAVGLFVVGGSLGLSLYFGLNKMLVATSQPENLIVLSKGAASEATSKLSLETARKLVLLPGVKNASSSPVAARELLTRIYLTIGGPDYKDPVVIRGYDEQSPTVHRIKIVSGAQPDPKSLDIMLGRRVAEKYPQLAGTQISLPGGAAKFVGVFSADGGPMEDEVWTPRAALELHVNTKFSSSMTLVAEDAGRVAGLVDKINDSKDLNAQAASVAKFREDGAGLSTIARTVFILLVLLSIVATSAIATTMNAAAATRMPELAAMAVIGIRRSFLARMVLVESIGLAVVGAVLGLLLFAGIRAWLGGVFALGASPIEISSVTTVLPIALGLGIVVGLLGGSFPALKVRRLDILNAIR
jgi:cell division protein FtsX